MAAQDRNPPKWNDAMSDGCSGVWDWFGSHGACVAHDKAYHYGGGVADKLAADDKLYSDLYNLGFPWSWGYAKLRYDGVRALTYSYPPGHTLRWGIRVEAFNWLGRPDAEVVFVAPAGSVAVPG